MSSAPSQEGRLSRATLSEVALLADVSISTVSKVLNGRAGVSTETRARIEALLQDRYNRRAPKRPVAPLLDVLCYEIDSPFASEVLASIELIARGRRIGMVLTGATEQHLPEQSWVDDVLERQPLGVVLVACVLPAKDKQRLRSRNIPLVMVDPAGAPAPDVPSIGSADWNGGYLATRHLLDLGHRRIGIITGPDDMLASTARLSGYRAALDSAGLPVDGELIRPGEFHHRDGLAEGRALLSLRNRPTAIFASSDLYALGVYEAARSLGFAIPGDLSVVGYDDLRIAQWAGPPLTTIHVPLVAMAEQAVHLIMRLRDEPELAFSRIDIDTTLVVRESTAPLRPTRRQSSAKVSNR
ncbi:LacI family DNA-binding transcriptional regulator [Rugosimonospora africana]|uniref:LacI family transcriptional regulator n=1 Tax=Rugosimonospora africana TaxID=556532 RepID=A0A8J3QTE3_9ACTN|nr:LacI family DNA-binding transcriptional regulator [Rugosimonospora africana]GIH15455.1 LacI family transcriptional regulator [Rugosimonospora africana]